MALPSPGWVAVPQGAPVTAYPLPERESFEYREAWDVAGSAPLPIGAVVHTSGEAGVDAQASLGADGVGILASLWVEGVYSVVLLDALFIELPVERAWAFTLDGHVFYVLSNVFGRSLVYDLTTGQWHQWFTSGRSFWNMLRGIQWRGLTIAAGIEGGDIWEVDPTSYLDEGVSAIERTVTGFQPVRGGGSIRQGALRLTARREALGVGGAVITMRFSDDGGHTWSRYFPVELQPEDVSKRIEFRGLGRMRAPGRIWEFSDTGGLVRIDGIDTDVDGGQ